MQRFINSIQNSLSAENWYGALSLSLTLPDICGRLEISKRGNKTTYINWYNKWLLATYSTPVGSSHENHVFLSGKDCYALRCSYSHQGKSKNNSKDVKKVLHNFHFISPPPNGNILHRNQITTQGHSVLQLQVDCFCNDMIEAVKNWLESVEQSSEIQSGMDSLLTIHDSSG